MVNKPKAAKLRANRADAQRLAELRTELDLSRNQLARRFGCTEGTVRWWENGFYTVPAPMLDWLAGLAQWVRKNPAPTLEQIER
jgi:transcriptional regulator with XRE-family HTH domain